MELKKIGIICEYNPFHNGHIYHLKKIKEMFPWSIIILVMSTNFTERGELSCLNKWDKTTISLKYGVDLVLELPHFYATNSADIFAEGAIKILSYMECDYLVFGSETDDLSLLNHLVDIQLNHPDYQNLVKEYLDHGYNYPTSMSKALQDLTGKKITSPNDLLGLSYIKQIHLQKVPMTPILIKRTNDYHSKKLEGIITSATSIRTSLQNNVDIKDYVPEETLKCIKKIDEEKVFAILKYKIISEIDHLDQYLDVNEGLENRIKKYILKSNSLEELINNVKTKRYTYNRLKRMFLHILTNLKKDDVTTFHQLTYIRVLGFTTKGKNYLKTIKNQALIPIITNYHELDDPILSHELRMTFLYHILTNQEELNTQELKSIPINII